MTGRRVEITGLEIWEEKSLLITVQVELESAPEEFKTNSNKVHILTLDELAEVERQAEARGYAKGAGDMEWQARTLFLAQRIPKSRAEMRSLANRFKARLKVLSPDTQAYESRIRGETLEEVERKVKRHFDARAKMYAGHHQEEDGMAINIFGDALDAIRALKADTVDKTPDKG